MGKRFYYIYTNYFNTQLQWLKSLTGRFATSWATEIPLVFVKKVLMRLKTLCNHFATWLIKTKQNKKLLPFFFFWHSIFWGSWYWRRFTSSGINLPVTMTVIQINTSSFISVKWEGLGNQAYALLSAPHLNKTKSF